MARTELIVGVRSSKLAQNDRVFTPVPVGGSKQPFEHFALFGVPPNFFSLCGAHSGRRCTQVPRVPARARMRGAGVRMLHMVINLHMRYGHVDHAIWL